MPPKRLLSDNIGPCEQWMVDYCFGYFFEKLFSSLRTSHKFCDIRGLPTNNEHIVNIVHTWEQGLHYDGINRCLNFILTMAGTSMYNFIMM